jgi:hypothetical protein
MTTPEHHRGFHAPPPGLAEQAIFAVLFFATVMMLVARVVSIIVKGLA